MYQQLMDKIYPLVKKYQLISDSQIVDFFTENLWDCLDDDFTKLYCDDFQDDLSKHPCVREFLRNFPPVDLNEMFPVRKYEEQNLEGKRKQKFQSDKKWHEIEQMSKMINENVSKNEHEHSELIIDAGAGKGYLSTYISQNYDFSVLAIESSNTVFHSALNYKDLLKRKTHQSYQKIKYVKEHIDDLTDYSKLATISFPDTKVNNLCLVGLHTCGSLVYSMVKSFLHNENIKTLCVVPCCYHLADSSFNETYHLTRNQRMLAQQRLFTTLDANSFNPSLFYRAILQVILKSLGLNNAKIGRGLYEQDFVLYAKKALRKIGVPLQEVPSDDTLKNVYSTYISEIGKFNLFHTLRLLIAPFLEIVIFLDIALHLQTNVHCSKVEIVKIFDSISPRSFCIIAKK